jgi:hypothetical protein
MADMVWDSPAMVRWSPEVTTDQVGASGAAAETRNFPDLRSALNFVMEELQATPRMNVGVYPERGSALIDLAYIEQAYRSHPAPSGEPGSPA